MPNLIDGNMSDVLDKTARMLARKLEARYRYPCLGNDEDAMSAIRVLREIGFVIDEWCDEENSNRHTVRVQWNDIACDRYFDLDGIGWFGGRR